MSQLKVDTITDEEGTGSPDFPNGITVNNGTINGTSIGATTASTGAFTTLTATGDVTIPDRIIHAGDTDTQIRFPANDTVTVETNGSERMRIDSRGFVGIGTSNPGGDGTFGQQARLDIAGTDGNIRIANTEADSTNKFGRLILRHFDAAERNSYLIGGANRDTENNVFIGGGSTTIYQATAIRFFTAANNTTTGSTERLRINSTGTLQSPGGSAFVGTVATGSTLGAIIQRGSNANGEFVRYADGTQIAWHTYSGVDVDSATGEGFRSSFIGYTLPVSFVGTEFHAGQLDTTIRWIGLGVTGFRGYGFTSGTGHQARIVTTGRWF